MITIRYRNVTDKGAVNKRAIPSTIRVMAEKSLVNLQDYITKIPLVI